MGTVTPTDMSASQKTQSAKDVVQRDVAQTKAVVARYLPSGQASLRFLRRLSGLLSTMAGMDRVFMVIQYSAPLFALLLSKSTDWSLTRNFGVSGPGKAGVRRTSLAASLLVVAAKLSEWRTIGRFFGLLPIISWAISLQNDATAPKNRKLRNIQKVQVLSMLAYYPLEHAYYLASQGIITMAPQKQLRSILWACRAWGLYVFLQLFHRPRGRCSGERARVLPAEPDSGQQRNDKPSLRPSYGTLVTREGHLYQWNLDLGLRHDGCPHLPSSGVAFDCMSGLAWHVHCYRPQKSSMSSSERYSFATGSSSSSSFSSSILTAGATTRSSS